MKHLMRYRLPVVLAAACALAAVPVVPASASAADTLEGVVPGGTENLPAAGPVTGEPSADPSAAGTGTEAQQVPPGGGAGTPEQDTGTGVSLTAPELEPVSVVDRKSVRFSWIAVPGAEGYELFLDGASIGTTGTETYTFRSKKLVWGEKYKVAVRAYVNVQGTMVCSELSAKETFRMVPGAPELKGVEAKEYNTVEVTWKKVPGADGYCVYRSADGGKLKKIGEVKGERTRSYTDETADLGHRYRYAVRAYWKKGSLMQTGEASRKGKASKTELQAPELEAVSYSLKAINVRWEEVPGAQGYIIYRKDKKENDYKRVAVVRDGSAVSWQDKKVTEGKKYYYTVQAYRKSDGHTYKSGMDKKGVTGLLRIKSRTVTVKDKKSALYGKKLRLYYHSDGTQLQNVESIIGSRSRYLLYVNKTRNQVTVYAVDGDVYVPVKAFICSTGAWAGATPSGTFRTQEKLRWHELMGPCWGQWCTRIHGGVLFHSVYYNSYHNNNNLSVSAYNRLGSAVSHGCVRLTSGDAKWIYDNCSLGTTVKIYSGSGYEPMEKPTAYKLSYGHTWDPTDPNMKYKCEQLGCH